METGKFLCKYYESVGGQGVFHCGSPCNPQGTEWEFNSRYGSAGRELFINSCSRADENGCSQKCRYYGEALQIAAANNSTEKTTEKSAALAGQNQKVGDHYTFVEKEGMCKFWKRDEANKRGYHCFSPANPEGEQKVFLTVGSNDAVQRYRKQCRRANADGEPERCAYYPGMQNMCEEGESSESGAGVVSAVKAAVKVGAALTNPAGAVANVVEDTINQIVDEM